MKTIYLDLDGVIVNWTKGVCDVCDVPYPSEDILRPYILDDILTRAQIEDAHRPTEFWEHLEIYPWGKQLVDLIDITANEWRFLTRANISAESYGGKALWIDSYFPKHREKLVICRGSKAFACKPGDILIDDHPKNIQEWNKANGRGYLWEELNSESSLYKDRLEDLKQFLLENYIH